MHFFKGFFIFVRGIKLALEHKVLRKWIYLPLILSTFLFVAGNFISIYYMPEFISSVLSSISSWWIYPLIAGVLQVTLWFSVSVFLLYGLFSLFAIIASPFHLCLSESLCREKNSLVVAELNTGKKLKLFFFLLQVSLKRVFLFSILGLIFFFLSFIPVISVFSNFAIMWIIALDSMDYVMELKSLPLRKRLKFSFSFFPFFLGVSSLLSVSFIIPGMILILFPFIVLGSTEYFLENH